MSRFNRFQPGRAVRRKPGEMNRTEQAYAEHLERRRECGEIFSWTFDALKLRLADNTFYTPDFFVQLADTTLEVHEVKGHWEDDARVKIKVAANMFPFRFLAMKPRAKKAGGGWEQEDFTGESVQPETQMKLGEVA